MTGARRLASLKSDERGLALVEFACVLPVLLLLYLAGYQVSDALSCNRKVTISARAIADLTTQNATVTTGQLDTILSAAGKVMAPYNIANAVSRVTELKTDGSGNTTVVWSRDSTGGGRTPNSSFTLPPNIKINNSFVILSEVTYSYKPAVNFSIVGPMPLGDAIYMNPRVSNSVDLSS
jgi:Flp pilus assembly protein TadG